MNLDNHVKAVYDAREQERMACCRDVCHFCHRLGPPQKGEHPGEWKHIVEVAGSPGRQLIMYCAASPILRRVAGG